MKKTMVSLAIIMSLAACSGTGDRTHDMPTITDSVSYQTPSDTHMRRNDTTPTTNNNIYNSDSSTNSTGTNTATQNPKQPKTKKQ